MSWRDRVRAPLRTASAYHVPPAGAVKLDANESPFPLSEQARAAIAAAVTKVELHRYPDPRAGALREVLAARLAVDPAQLVFGNGSDELIAVLCGTFGEPDERGPARVLVPSPSFVMFKIEALTHGLLPVDVPFGAGFVADEAALIEALRRERPSLVFLATPNNPTGTVWPRASLERILAEPSDAIIIIDEAYVAYSGEASCLPLVAEHERCVVMQTLSKIGLAGLRTGYLYAQPAVVAELEKARPPYNLDSLSQAAAVAMLTHAGDELTRHAEEIAAERDGLAVALADLGFEVFPSGANFVLCRHADALNIDKKLRAAGIAVRCFDRGVVDPLQGCLRITIGTDTENATLLAALR